MTYQIKAGLSLPVSQIAIPNIGSMMVLFGTTGKLNTEILKALHPMKI